MAALGQSSLFMIRAGDERLDAALDARGYAIADPTVLYAAPISALGPAPDPMAAFAHWPPLAITEAIWSQHDIGPARLAIMQRAADPRAAILGRSRDRPAGAAFVAVRKTIAVLHAVVVPVALRRQGCGANLVRRAADWAGEQGADRLVLAVTTTNHGARALYASLGMEAVGHYHYRMK